MTLRVLGVDPGLASTGVGAIELRGDGSYRALGWRRVATQASSPLPARLERIHSLVAGAIEEFRPTVFAIEDIFFARNVRSAVAMAHGRGVAVLAAASRKLEVREFAPREIKLAVAGSGRASKEQLRRLVGIHLGLKVLPDSDHESDALAIALCAAFRERGVVATAQRGAASAINEEDPRKALLALAMKRRRR